VVNEEVAPYPHAVLEIRKCVQMEAMEQSSLWNAFFNLLNREAE